MSKFTKGMKAGTEPFKDFFDEQSEELRTSTKNINESIDDINENISDIIDLIEMNDAERSEFIKEIKKRKSKNIKPAKFTIKIITANKADWDFADNLRKNLNYKSNSSHIISSDEYQKKHTGIDDYNIFIRDSDKLVDEKCEKIFSAYGCEIFLHNKHDIIVVYSDSIEDYDREAFIRYYSELVTKVNNNNKKAEQAQKALDKRKKQEPIFKNVSEQSYNYILDNVAGKPVETVVDMMDSGNTALGILGVLLVVPSFLLSAGILLTSLLMYIPMGLGEIIGSELIEKIRDSDFDNKFIAEAKRQILQIKLCEYISTEQLRLAK